MTIVFSPFVFCWLFMCGMSGINYNSCVTHGLLLFIRFLSYFQSESLCNYTFDLIDAVLNLKRHMLHNSFLSNMTRNFQRIFSAKIRQIKSVISMHCALIFLTLFFAVETIYAKFRFANFSPVIRHGSFYEMFFN